eukprot:TRINITY_DN2736_c0_g1_i2.p1 TRINITY_DN2736_c0_g1~~TRINITY_DN2736_c0_g1_i2.p1  ORF type:complete len:241 (-),score=40.08 TRINITY_DN2736_c0_g1_i2:286-1008(-)
MEKPFAPSGGSQSYGVAGNGYFATWMAMVGSSLLFFCHVTPVADIMKKVFGELDDTKKMLLAIFLASLLEMWHAARICDEDSHCEGMLAWGVSAGAISSGLILIFVLLLKFVPSMQPHAKFFAAFLALWWIAAVCTLTMPNGEKSCSTNDRYCQGLFLSASNGFFGTWVAMILSVVLTGQLFGVSIPGAPPGGGQQSPPAEQSPPAAAVEAPQFTPAPSAALATNDSVAAKEADGKDEQV